MEGLSHISAGKRLIEATRDTLFGSGETLQTIEANLLTFKGANKLGSILAGIRDNLQMDASVPRKSQSKTRKTTLTNKTTPTKTVDHVKGLDTKATVDRDLTIYNDKTDDDKAHITTNNSQEDSNNTESGESEEEEEH